MKLKKERKTDTDIGSSVYEQWKFQFASDSDFLFFFFILVVSEFH